MTTEANIDSTVDRICDLLIKNAHAPPEMVPILRKEITKTLLTGDTSTLGKIQREDYDFVPVGIREFIESEEYLGSVVANLHEGIKQELEYIFNPMSNITTVVLTGSIGWGKALPLATQVLTPTGWAEIGQLRVGDSVIGSQGIPVTVTGVFLQGPKDIYRCSFSDGATVECCEDHLWAVNSPSGRQHKTQGRVLPLREIKRGIKNKRGQRQHFIPVVCPVQFVKQDLPLDPYLLGALLGDGAMSSGNCHLSSADKELLERVSSSLPIPVKLKHIAAYDYRLTCGQSGQRNNPVRTALRTLGLFGKTSLDKFVPAIYKFSSVEDRIDLLHGLMDTDGSVELANNKVEFCSSSRQLAEDVVWLVRSLGGIATFCTNKSASKNLRYRVRLAMPNGLNPFWLTRKAEAYKPRQKYPPSRAFNAVEFVGKKEAVCISVDAADGLFVTEDFIVTHNTTTSMVLMAYLAYRLCCLKRPQSYYGLLSGSRIVLGIFNVTLTKANSGYELLRHYIDNCPWFKKNCPKRVRPKDPILFESKNISIEIGSLATHALGEHIFSFTMDEADFYKKTADQAEKTRAHQLFSQARARIESRFIQYGGKIPGLAILMSSRRTEAHFLEQLLEEIEADPKLSAQTHVMSYALWETKDPDKFCGERFDVLVGDDKLASRILEPDELVPFEYRTVSIPIEFEHPFRLDVEIALRDVAGVSTAGSYLYLDPIAVKACTDDRPNPFKVDTVDTLTLGSGNKLQDYLNLKNCCDMQRSSWMPKLHPGAPRYAHVDIGLTGEALGLAVGHAVPYTDGGIGVCYDFLIRVQGRPTQEVDLTAVVEFLLYIQRIGYRLSMVTYDSFQSRHSIQLLTTHKVVSGIQSVDINCYTVLKSLIATGRCRFYNYLPVVKELSQLRRSSNVNSGDGIIVDIDRPHHPSGGSDDIADAMAAVAMHVSGLSKVKKSELGDDSIVNLRPLILFGNTL